MARKRSTGSPNARAGADAAGRVRLPQLRRQAILHPVQSMMPNLLVGDRLVVSKYPYGWNWSSISFHLAPRGDWRIFGSTPGIWRHRHPRPSRTGRGLYQARGRPPGDRFAVSNGQIILNGVPVPQKVEPPVDIPVDLNSPCNDYPEMKTTLPWANGSAKCRSSARRCPMGRPIASSIISTRCSTIIPR